MADVTSEAILAVGVEGDDNIKRLIGDLGNLQKAAESASRAVAAASAKPSAASPAGGAAVGEGVFQKWLTDKATAIGASMSKAFGASVTQSIKAPFEVLRTSGQMVGRALLGVSGPLGQIAGQAGIASTAIVGVGLALTGLAIPIINLVAGLKLLRSSFGWAQEAADEQIRIAGRTARFFPEAVGESVAGAEEQMRVQMRTASALLGEGADQLQETITRRLTAFRLGRGLRGEKDIFARWGITPEAIQRYERMTGGRIDLAKWLELFVIKREQLEKNLQEARTPHEAALAQRQLSSLMDDSLKIFDQKFATMVGVVSQRDITKLKGNLEAALRVGAPPPNATRNAVDFKIALESIKATFLELTTAIGADVQPTITKFLTALNEKMLGGKDGVDGLAGSIRALASEMANKTYQILADIMGRIKPETINNWIQAIRDWKPEQTLANIVTIFNAIAGIGKAIGSIITAINQILESPIGKWLLKNQAAQSSLGATVAQATGRGGELAEQQAAQAAEAAAEAARPLIRRQWQDAARRRRAATPSMGGGGAAPSAPAAVGAAEAAAQPSVQPSIQPPAVTPAAPPPAAAGPTASAPGAPSAVAAAEPAAGAPPPTQPQEPAAGGMTQQAPQTPAVGAVDQGAGGPAASGTQPAAKESWWSRVKPNVDLRSGNITFGKRAEETGLAHRASYTTEAAADAIQGAATGRAAGMLSLTSDIKEGPSGPELVMRAEPRSNLEALNEQLNQYGGGWYGDRLVQPAALSSTAATGLWAGGQALEFAGVPGAGSVGHAVGRAGAGGDRTADVFKGLIPGWGALEMMNRDAQQGHPLRSKLREYLGLPDPKEPAPWQAGGQFDPTSRGLTQSEFDSRFGVWPQSSGGITAEDGTQFGTAAATALRDGLEGVSVGGPATTSYGVAPRTAPKPTGGDTATEA